MGTAAGGRATMSIPTPTLHTERLTLRPPTEADIPAWQRYFADWEVIKNLSTQVPWPYPEDGVVEHWELRVQPALAANTSWHWAITERERPGVLIGTVDLKREADENGNRGFWLGRPFWGRGYMTEAVAAIQDWLFTQTEVSKITIKNALSNVASRRIKEKTGAEFVGNDTCAHNSGDNEGEVWEVHRQAWLKLRGLSER
jgi:RimJ/RimL family protein N-acetyltransferase